MKVLFKYPRRIDKQSFSKGPAELPDALKDHWYVKALVQSGDLVLGDEPVVESPKPVDEAKPVEQDQWIKPEKKSKSK